MSTLRPYLYRLLGACVLLFYGITSVQAGKTGQEDQEISLPRACKGVDQITIFAATSMGPALEALNQLLAESDGPKLRISLASSSVLARQIAKGAPADIYLTADEQWNEHLKDSGMLREDAPIAFARNRLVLAFSNDRSHETHNLVELLQDPDIIRIATGDPDNVPLGQYAVEMLLALNLWDETRGKLLPALDARAALLFLEAGAAEAAILYASDAAGSDRIGTIFPVHQNLYSPINYWVLAPKNGNLVPYTCGVEVLLGSSFAKILSLYSFYPPS